MTDITPAKKFEPTDGRWPLSIAALLDDSHHQQARFLQRAWSKAQPEADPLKLVPHMSLHVATAYGDGVRAIVSEVAASQAPLPVRCGGLGFFTTTRPVVYVPVVRDDRLSTLHSQLWSVLSKVSLGTLHLYAPEAWLPHVTLAQGPLDTERLAALLEVPAARGPQWHATLKGLALVESAPEGDRVIWEETLRG
jgi:2'-5' RNA ligase